MVLWLEEAKLKLLVLHVNMLELTTGGSIMLWAGKLFLIRIMEVAQS